MSKHENVKDRIIFVTIELIEQYGGDTKSITARMIAEKAEVGLGLINYHFGSKDNLITGWFSKLFAFLGNETVNQLLGYDFTKPKDRAEYIEKLVDILFEGAEKANE